MSLNLKCVCVDVDVDRVGDGGSSKDTGDVGERGAEGGGVFEDGFSDEGEDAVIGDLESEVMKTATTPTKKRR